MKTTCVRTISAGVLVLLGVAVSAAAQENSSTDVLSRTELQAIITAADTPAAHVQLRNHFAALADQYDADARRHAVMAKTRTGNPNRVSGADMAGHCRRLGTLAADTAKTARTLAAHHDRLAAGVAATIPSDPQHLREGTGAPEMMSDAHLHSLAANANTQADHGRLREYFTMLASRCTANADTHAAMAASYRASPRPGLSAAAVHCERLVAQQREAAAAAMASAAEHQTVAK